MSFLQQKPGPRRVPLTGGALVPFGRIERSLRNPRSREGFVLLGQGPADRKWFRSVRFQVAAMVDSRREAEFVFLAHGEEEALASLFTQYEDRLRRMVVFRLNPRLRGRIDPSDILQESYLSASQRLAGYLEKPAAPVFIWLRGVTEQTMIDVHRRHLGAQARNASLEVSFHRSGHGIATSVSLAAHLVADMTSPSQAAIREEALSGLREAFDEMDSTDREVLALRHFEGLSNMEVAAILELQPTAASNRYIRALRRLKSVLVRMPSYGNPLAASE